MKKSYAAMDPVEEIRAIRVEMMRKFKTLDALCGYLDNQCPASSSPKAKAVKKPPGRGKSAKRPMHV